MGKQQVKELIRIHLFKPGTFVSASGQPVSFTEDNLKEIVSSYSKNDEAPLCLGHQANDRPAYGWVDKLEKTAKGVDAVVRVTKQVKDAIADELYKKVSGSLYLPQTKNNPVPGKLYLKHIALLGAAAPAIKSLEPIALSDVEDGFIEFSEDFNAKQEEREVEMPTDDKTVEKTSQEAAKQEVKSEEVKETSTDAVKEDDQATKNADETARIAKESAELEKKQAEFAEQQKQAKSKEINEFANDAVAKGHIKQDLKQDVKDFMESLDATATLDFSDDKKETQMDFFKKFVASQKTTANFSEVASGDAAPLDFNDPSQVCDAIMQAQADAAKQGIKLTEAEALSKIKGE